MNIDEIEYKVCQQLHQLPLDSAEEVLDFALFLKQRIQEKSRSPVDSVAGKLYAIVELGGTEPDLKVAPRRREEVIRL